MRPKRSNRDARNPEWLSQKTQESAQYAPDPFCQRVGSGNETIEEIMELAVNRDIERNCECYGAKLTFTLVQVSKRLNIKVQTVVLRTVLREGRTIGELASVMMFAVV